MNTCNIYVDIDSILDTRFTLAAGLNNLEFAKFVSSGRYHNRLKDTFGNLSEDIFKSIYRNRTKHLLYLSPFTNMIRFILEQYFFNKAEVGVLPDEEAKIYINVYPYKMDNEDVIKLKKILDKELGECKLTFIRISKRSLTTVKLSDMATFAIMYNGLEWLEMQTSNLETVHRPIPNVTLILPKLLSGSVSSKDITDETFEKLTELYRFFIEINFINARFFSKK